jgi:hypothetical protein
VILLSCISFPFVRWVRGRGDLILRAEGVVGRKMTPTVCEQWGSFDERRARMGLDVFKCSDQRVRTVVGVVPVGAVGLRQQ